MLIKEQTLLDFFLLIGIRRSQKSQISRIQFLSILIIFLYSISVTHYVFANLNYIARYRSAEGLSYIFEAGNALLMWCSLIIKRKKILHMLLKLFTYRKRYSIDKNRSRFVTILIIAVLFLFFGSYQALLCISDTNSKTVVNFWTFNSNLPEGTLKLVILTLINVFQYTCYIFPISLSLIMSVLFYNFAEILQIYKKKLQFHLRCQNKQEIMIILIDYFKIRKTISKLYHILSYPTFFVVVFSFSCFFTSTLVVLKYHEMLTSHYLNLVDVCEDILTGFFVLVPYTVFSSRITDNLFEIKQTIQNELNELACKQKQMYPEPVFECLRRIEKDEIAYISAGGLFHLSRGFILTAVGTLLTYGLLIINLL